MTIPEKIICALFTAVLIFFLWEKEPEERVNPLAISVHEHETPSGKSCFMFYDGKQIVGFTCDSGPSK